MAEFSSVQTIQPHKFRGCTSHEKMGRSRVICGATKIYEMVLQFWDHLTWNTHGDEGSLSRGSAKPTISRGRPQASQFSGTYICPTRQTNSNYILHLHCNQTGWREFYRDDATRSWPV